MNELSNSKNPSSNVKPADGGSASPQPGQNPAPKTAEVEATKTADTAPQSDSKN